MHNTTIPEEQSEAAASPTARDAMGLAIVWCQDEPRQLGALLIPPFGNPGSWCVFGRGEDRPEDPHPRLHAARHRPGQIGPALPVASRYSSRVQLRLRAVSDRQIEVERLGALTMSHNSTETDRATLEEGDILQLGRRMVLLVTRRPAWLPAHRTPIDEARHAFGAADRAGIVGESAAIWALRERVDFVAARLEHVLITGPTGAGKELVARALHAASSHSSRPMIARNAATFPDSLVDAELFGNSRNYPNAGMPERPGLIGEANGSVLFLDEIAELPAQLQAHLLRVLDSGEYHRLGESQARRSSFRLVAATNRPPADLKTDLAARLLLRIEVPDLNARREDVPWLARHLMRRHAATDRNIAARFFCDGNVAGEPRFSPELIGMLASRSYSANVRELEALLIDAVAGSTGDVIECVRRRSASVSVTTKVEPTDGRLAFGDPDGRRELQQCLDEHHGSIEHTWRALGLSSRHVLVRLIAKYGLRAGRTWRPTP